MTYYVIFDKKRNYRGYMTSKKDLETFKRQRNQDNYHILKVKKENENKQLIRSIVNSNGEIIYHHGYIMFPDEEEYFTQAFDQLTIDIYCRLKDIIKKCMPIIKYEKEEEKVLHEFLRLIYSHMKEFEKALESNDIDGEDVCDRFFKIGKMVEHIIRIMD